MLEISEDSPRSNIFIALDPPQISATIAVSHTRPSLAKFSQNSERNARGEQCFDDRRLRHQPLQSEIENPLERLLAQGPQHLQLVQDAAEVMLLLLRVRIVSHVVPERVDDLGL